MENCTHDCSTCSANCGERDPKSFLVPQNERSDIKNVIAVMSGKGGVGKSYVTSLLASAVAKRGARTAILDADVTGPSIPKAFGLPGQAESDGTFLYPAVTKGGIKVMSMNLLLGEATDPVVWRGPVIAGAVKQFWTDVAWDMVDYMFVDMPPGTGDVPLTVFQSLPVSGIIVVTSPQDLVSMIVEKAVRMAGLMEIPVLSIVENMSYYKCPDCGKEHEIFGHSHVREIAQKYGVDTCSRLPLSEKAAEYMDQGTVEEAEVPELKDTIDKILGMR
ncbi:MAG: Mrp/NBP35 family ATP-binding protein [Lachnospiraceae bacterium]|nr:Mrp/NBP35 family ATP-binding protein [Lachnospiraceae bacterium]